MPDDPHRLIADIVEGCTPSGAHEIPLSPPPRVAAKGKDRSRATSKDRAEPKKDPSPKQRRPARRDTLMGLTSDCSLWHGEDGDAYVTFSVGNHRETWPIRSQAFKRWLSARAYTDLGFAPGAQDVEDTLRVLEARATNEGREQKPWIRVGERNGNLYIDLCDRQWRAIEITRRGFTVLEGHDLPFVRSPAMRPLPMPEEGCLIDELRGFVNVATDEDFVLFVAWLVAALRPRGPYPILVVNGEQGSGKSAFTRLVRIPTKPAMHSNRKPATCSDLKPARVPI